MASPKPVPGILAGCGLVGLAELVKNVGKISFTDADSCILNSDN